MNGPTCPPPRENIPTGPYLFPNPLKNWNPPIFHNDWLKSSIDACPGSPPLLPHHNQVHGVRLFSGRLVGHHRKEVTGGVPSMLHEFIPGTITYVVRRVGAWAHSPVEY